MTEPRTADHGRWGPMNNAVAVVPAGGSGARMGSRQPKQYLAAGGRAHPRAHPRARWPAAARSTGSSWPRPRTASRRLASCSRDSACRACSAVVAGRGRAPGLGARGLAGVAAGRDVDRRARCREAVRHPGARRARAGGGPRARRRDLRLARAGDRQARARPVVEATLPREGLWLTQTPQAFRRALLAEAHDKAVRDGYRATDDAMLIERLGGRVVHGRRAAAESEDHDAGRSQRRRARGPAGRGGHERHTKRPRLRSPPARRRAPAGAGRHHRARTRGGSAVIRTPTC